MKKVKIKLNGGIMPKKASEYAAAYDVYAPEDIDLHIGRQVVDLKFSIELPHGYAAVIQPRSGFSSNGVETVGIAGEYEAVVRVDADVLLGLIDEDYRGSVGVIIKVATLNPLLVKTYISKGTRIAQMRIVRVPETELVEVSELDMSNDRGGGFGHTGCK